MNCQKYRFKVAGCSRLFNCEQCLESILAKPFIQRWSEKVKEIVKSYSIHVGKKKDELSARRFAILISEAFTEMLTGSQGLIDLLPIIEKDHYELAIAHRLYCDPIPAEEKAKRGFLVWGIDRRSGLEGSTCGLKDWTLQALLELQGVENGGAVNIGSRPYEDFRPEEAGVG